MLRVPIPRSAREAEYRRLGRAFGRVFVRLILKRVPVVVALSVDLEEKKSHVYIGICTYVFMATSSASDHARRQSRCPLGGKMNE